MGGPYFNGRIPCLDHGDQGSTPCGPRCSVSATTTKKRTGFMHTWEDQWLVSVLFLGLYSNGKIPCLGHGDQDSTPCGPRCSVSATTTKKRTGFMHTYEDLVVWWFSLLGGFGYMAPGFLVWICGGCLR